MNTALRLCSVTLLILLLIQLQTGNASAVPADRIEGPNLSPVVHAPRRRPPKRSVPPSTPANFLKYGGSLSYKTRPKTGGGRYQMVFADLTPLSIAKLSRPTKPKPKTDPSGWAAIGVEINAKKGDNRRQRCHMLGAQLGGSNTELKNFFTCHDKTNSPGMRYFEDLVKSVVLTSNAFYENKAGAPSGSGKVEYEVIAVFDVGSAYPPRIYMRAHQVIGAHKRTLFAVWIENKPNFLGTIQHLCKPWFNQSFGPSRIPQATDPSQAPLCSASSATSGFWLENK